MPENRAIAVVVGELHKASAHPVWNLSLEDDGSLTEDGSTLDDMNLRQTMALRSQSRESLRILLRAYDDNRATLAALAAALRRLENAAESQNLDAMAITIQLRDPKGRTR